MSKISKNNNRKYRVRTASSLNGWRQRLHGVYSSLEEFRAFCGVYNNHITLGYNTPEEAWEDNPIVEGGTNLSDYRNVSTGYHYSEHGLRIVLRKDFTLGHI